MVMGWSSSLPLSFCLSSVVASDHFHRTWTAPIKDVELETWGTLHYNAQVKRQCVCGSCEPGPHAAQDPGSAPLYPTL